MMQRRRRLIRSGHFGALRQSNSEKKEGMVTVKRTRNVSRGGVEDNWNSSFLLNLSYVIYRPDLIHSTVTGKKPLLVIHGGPSIPSDYLQPMSKTLSERCVIFYDQIGCGNSSMPSDLNFYSIKDAVNDLENFVRHLKLKEFHIYGHSFGGILAYEYSKKQCERYNSIHKDSSHDDVNDRARPTLLSITLCSTPSNLQGVEDESKSLLDSCGSNDMDDALEHCDEGTYNIASFQNQFVCRTNDGILPIPLQEAYKKKGSVWEGHDAIIDYVAQPMNSVASDLPPTMLLRGEYDFVSAKYGVDEWRKLINHSSVVCHTINDCAHYAMLENSSQHSMRLGAFLDQLDNTSSVTTVSQ